MALRRGNGRRLGLDPAVVRLNLNRQGVVRAEHLEERGRGHAADGKFLGAVDEFAPADTAMHVLVK